MGDARSWLASLPEFKCSTCERTTIFEQCTTCMTREDEMDEMKMLSTREIPELEAQIKGLNEDLLSKKERLKALKEKYE
jgi:hypothetical protein